MALPGRIHAGVAKAAPAWGAAGAGARHRKWRRDVDELGAKKHQLTRCGALVSRSSTIRAPLPKHRAMSEEDPIDIPISEGAIPVAHGDVEVPSEPSIPVSVGSMPIAESGGGSAGVSGFASEGSIRLLLTR